MSLRSFLLAVLGSGSLLLPMATVSAQDGSHPTAPAGDGAEATVVVEDPAKVLPRMVKSITEEACYEHVQVLAGKDMRGRGTMSPGFDKAADYVVEQLKAAGIEGAGKDGSYRLPIRFSAVVAGQDCRFDWSQRDPEEAPLEVEKDFVPVLGTKPLAAQGEAVFVGYAIDSKKEQWVDLKPRDVRGKIVFAFTREPRADDPKFKRFEGAEATRESSIKRKAQAVYDAGGLALVLVPDPALISEEDLPLSGMVPYVTPTPPNVRGLIERLGLPEIPVASVSRAVAGRIFGVDLAAYAKSIDKKLKPKLLKGGKDLLVSLQVSLEAGERQAYNLGARLPGTAKDGKVLILGAHLDHVGFDLFNDQMRTSVHPGADDNASGSATLLTVAQAFAGHRPVHDVLFLWFCGEELGLLGSRQYCKEPLYPHEDTIAMLNMDMVGRGEDDILNIGGLWDRPQWEAFINKQHKRIKSRLKLDNEQGRDLYARSDQYSFHQEGVVGLFFFEADLQKNKVYHQVGDIAESIGGRKMERIGQLFAAVAWALAFEDLKP